MSTNWQYGRWRRVGLNVAVWLVFAGALALAYYLGRQRGAGVDVTFGEPEPFEALLVRKIQSAQHRVEPGPPPALVSEMYDHEGRLRRSVWVTCERQSGRARGPNYYLESLLKVDVEGESERFDFLGARGVIFAWKGMPPHYWFEPSLDEEKIKELPKQGLYACTVLPDGLTVTVQVRGDGAYGPSARQLLRKVADGLKVADKVADTAAGNSRS
jgi:hypothetical protein